MRLAITANEFMGSIIANNLYGLAVAAVGAAVTGLVNKALCAIANRVFTAKTPEQKKALSFGIKAISLAAGVAASYFIAPHATLVALTARKFFEVIGLGFAIAAGLRLFMGETKPSIVDYGVVAFSSAAALIGFGGMPVLVGCGVAGAAAGAYLF